MGYLYDGDDVHSGETMELDERYRVLKFLYQADNESGKITSDIGQLWDESMVHWESKEIEGSGDPRPFFESLKNVRKVPASSFIISFLAGRTDFPVEEANIKRLMAFAEDFAAKYEDKSKAAKNKGIKKILETDIGAADEDQMTEVQLMANFSAGIQDTMRIFPELRKKIEGAAWPEYFRTILFDIDFSHLRDIAFAFEMDNYLFEIFLQKVLHRSYINFFNREEILTYVVLSYYDSTDGTRDRFLLYGDLLGMYPVREGSGKHPEKIGEVVSEDVATSMVQQEVDGLLGKIEKCGKDVFTYSAELHDALDWVFDRAEKKKFKRSAEREFNDGLRELLEKMSSEISILDYIDGTEVGQEDEEEGLACRPLTIKYVAEHDLVLEKGICFHGDSNIAEKSSKVQANFKLTEDVPLSADRKRKISVPVEPLTLPADGETASGFVKMNAVNGLFAIDSVPSSSPRYRVTGEYTETKELEIEVESCNALSYVANSRNKNGELHIICAPGTTIFEDTVFSFESEGRRYQYKVRETVTAPDAAEALLPVVLLNGDELLNKKVSGKKHKDKIVVVESHTEIYSDEVDAIEELEVRSISNNKPVKVADLSEGGVNSSAYKDVNLYKLFVHLYGKERYEGVMSYGPSFLLNTSQFRAAMLSYNSVSAFPKSEVKARDMLLTLTFLNFVSDNLDKYSYPKEMSRAEGRIRDFTTRCNSVMNKCGFQNLYSGNPYDEFLKRLLTSESPLDLYTTIFSDKHLMTQYIKVNIPEECGPWSWKVMCEMSDGSCETWGQGQVEKGTQLITLPRLIERIGANYEIEVTYCENSAEKKICRKIDLNAEQEFEMSI